MLLDTWLPVASDIDSSSENTEYINMQTPLSLSTTFMTPDVDQDEFLRYDANLLMNPLIQFDLIAPLNRTGLYLKTFYL